MSFRLTSNIGQVRAQLAKRASALVQGIAASIEGDIKAQFREPKSGRIYYRGGKKGKKKTRRRHQASAPGEAPAIDYGILHARTRWQAETRFRAIVGTSADYAEILEFGGARMKARPFFGPAFERHRTIFEAGMKSLIS